MPISKYFFLRAFIFCLGLGASFPAFATTGQFVNGGFNDSGFGNDTGWTDNYQAISGTYFNIFYDSPGQGGSGNCIQLEANNTFTQTYIYQDVYVESGAFVPFLDFWYIAQNASGGTTDASQLVQIRDTSNNVLATPLNICQNNAFAWVNDTYNLSAYEGQTVRFFFAANATGAGGYQSDFYLDTISIDYATYTPTASPTPTRTPSFTRSPTFTHSPTVTVSATVSPSPTQTELPSQVVNGNFASTDYGTTSGYTAWNSSNNSDITPYSSYNGSNGVEILPTGQQNVATLTQDVYIPTGAVPTLNFWYQPNNGDGNAAVGGSQLVEIRSADGSTLLATVFQQEGNNATWFNQTFDLSPYEGQDIQLYFAATNGSGSGCFLALADISIIYTPYTPTVTPTFSYSPTVTQSFTHSPTFTVTPSDTPTATPTATETWTKTATPTDTPTDSPSVTATGTRTNSPTISPTFTHTPTFTPSPDLTPTPTWTPTLPYLSSNMGRVIAAPVPAMNNAPICLYYDRPPASSIWKLFNIAGELVGQLSFGNQYAQCWDHKGIAAGVYILMWNVKYSDGSSSNGTQKIVLIN